MQHATWRTCNARDRAQVFIYGTQISLAHTLIHGPGHDLQQITVERLESGEAVARHGHRAIRVQVIVVLPGAKDMDELRKGESAGWPSGSIGCQIPRNDLGGARQE